MAALTPYVKIDFSNRLNAIREVGQGLGLPAASIPDRKSANSQRTYLKWINTYRAAQSLPLLSKVDYTGFQAALNALAVLGTTRPQVLTVPVVTGATTQGSTLTSTNGTWSNAPSSFTYQWQRNGANIGGATTNTRVIAAADTGGKMLTCIVTASNAAGASTPATSNQVFIA